MIQRRRPIESAIAERRMFNMGGMAAPMQQPTYMDLMQQGIMGMPQQAMGMPQQAQGIMASSQPLVDAIAADANNPAGGDTLSMAQGGLASEELMARGFAPGGLFTRREIPLSLAQRKKLGEEAAAKAAVAKTAGLSPPPEAFAFKGTNPDLYTMESLYNPTELEIQNYRNIYGKVDLARRQALDSVRPSRNLLAPIYDSFTKGRLETDELARIREEEYGIKTKEFERIKNLPLDFWLTDLGASNKERQWFSDQNNVDLVKSAGRSTDLTVNPNIIVGDLQQADFDEPIIKGNIPAGEDNPNEIKLARSTGPDSLIRSRYPGMSDEDVAMIKEAMALNPESTLDEIVSVSFPADMIESLKNKDGDASSGAARFSTGMDDTILGGDGPIDQEAAAKKKPQSPPDVTGTATPAGGVLDEVDAAAYTAANQVAKTLDTDKKADGKTIEDFKKQFMEAMPKYEGMSEEEKGFLIAEAGLRVMAGKSPNAIENIAKGLQGLGPALMKGEKEKRAWKRQVELSAAKYALEGTARADAKADALAKEGRVRKQFIVGKTFTDLSGVKREKGSLYTPTAAEMGTDSFQRNILPNLTTEGIYKERLDNAGALTGIVRVGAKHGPSAEGVTKALDAYTDLTKDVRNNAKMLTMLDASIVQNAKGEVTGFAPWASKKINQLKNATGYKKQIKILDGIDTSTGQGLERFQYQQQVIANMMLKEILGEGSKNVSNIDRTLASEIVGLLKGFSSIYADPAVLHQKLQGIRGVVQQGLRGSLTKMRNSEVGFGNTYTAFAPGSPGLNVSDQMAEQRRSLLGDIQGVGQRTQSRSEAAGRAPVVLKASDYFDFDKMTIRKNLP